MATAKRLPSGSWRCLAYVGKDVTKSGYKSFTAPTKKEAERLALEYEQGVQQAIPELTVKAAIDQYIASKQNILSPSTVAGYKKISRSGLTGLKNLPLKTLTNAQMQDYFNLAAKTKSAKTLKNEYALLCSSVRAVIPKFDFDVHLPTVYRAEMHIPDDAGVRRLLAQANAPMKKAISLAAVVGLRRSEICALTTEDIDPATGRISITKAKVKDPDGKWVTKAPKTKTSKRTVVAPPELCLQLLEDVAPGGLVVPLVPNSITEDFERIRARADCPGIRFHDLRHYAVSVMIALNIPTKYIMNITGHATPNMVNNVYGHIMDDRQKEAFDAIQTHYQTSINR